MKMAVFWDVAPCSLVDVYRRFRGVAASIRAPMMVKASTSEIKIEDTEDSCCILTAVRTWNLT
jgi:hypothetical protein